MKLATQYLILYLMLLNPLVQECAEGCLKCSGNNNCEVCDFSGQYFLQAGSCIQGGVTSCKVYSLTGQCLQCLENNYLDSVTNQCLEVPESVRIANCSFYQTESSCLVCAPSFYLNGLTCSATNQVIDNCVVYASVDTCSECLSGYIVRQDQKACLAFKDTPNCQTFTSIKCEACKTSYFLQSNFFQIWIPHILKTDLVKKEQRAVEAASAVQIPTSGNCELSIPTNCSQLQDFATCQICNTGYYLKSGQCIANPPQAIPHCLDYTSQTRCRNCANNFRLSTPPDYKCIPVENVQFCAIFDGKAFTTKCLECQDRYYLKFENLCEERTLTVENCLRHAIAQDQCEECEIGYDLTDDGKKCLPETPSCAVYYESDINSTELECQQCIDSHFLNSESLCTVGTTQNCKAYERTLNQCRLCNDTYFLNADLQCEQQPLIDGCSKYDPYTRNRCVECQYDRFLLTLQTECQNVTIANCRIHKTIDHCAECHEGYTLLNNGTCEQLDASLNCLVGEYGLCIKCKVDYQLEQGLCVLTKVYEKDECLINEMPIDYKSSLQCTDKEEFVRLGLDGNTFDSGNCLSYEFDTDFNFKCLVCETNFVPDQTGACVPVASNPICTDDATFFYRDLNFKVKTDKENLLFVKENTCLPLAKPNAGAVNSCKKYGVSKGIFNANKDTLNGCLECQSATNPERYFQQIDVTTTRETLSKDATNIYWKSEFQCMLKTTTNAANDFADIVWGDQTKIDNCEYFYALQHDKLGCLRCKNNFKGVVKNQAIDRCLEYDAEQLKCTKCQENYLIEEGGKKCTFYNSLATNRTYLTNCELESFDETKCYLCKPNFTLVNDGSACNAFTSTTVTNCSVFKHNSAAAIPYTCERCEDEYYLTADGLNCWKVDNCLVPASATTCTTCKLGYSKNAGNTCDLIANCLFNEENSTTCLVSNPYNVDLKNTCTAVTAIDNCIALDQTTGKCSACAQTHYLFNDGAVSQCVLYGSFLTGLTNTTHTNDNCKEFYIINDAETFDTPARYGCKACSDGYHFADPDTKTLAGYNCVQDNYFDRASTDVQNLLLSEYTPVVNCGLYDFLSQQCSECTATAYWSTDRCCEAGSYSNGSSCVTIPAADFPSCDQLQLVQNQGFYECTRCSANTLVDGVCTATAPCDNYSKGACVDKTSLNCATYDIEQNECSTCNANHYLVPGQRQKCCPDDQFYQTGNDCVLINAVLDLPDDDQEVNIETNCIRFDDVSDTCLLCKANYSWNGQYCVKTSTLYENCSKLSEFDNKCETCSTNYYLTTASTCCNYSTNNTFSLSSGDCLAVDAGNQITQCKFYSANAANSCTTCNDGFYNVSNQLCCQYGQFASATPACFDLGTSYDYCEQISFGAVTKGDISCASCQGAVASDQTAQTEKVCCKKGQKVTGDACVDDTTCLFYANDGTTCLACPSGKQLIAGACVAIPSNCATTADPNCYQCNFKNIFDTTGNTCGDSSSVSVKGGLYCAQYDSTNANTPKDCTTCLNIFQISGSTTQQCCPVGTYFTSDSLCEKIPVENCATWDGTKCTKCFEDVDNCQVVFDFTTELHATQSTRYLDNRTHSDLRVSIQKKYYLGTDTKKNCCPFGQFYNGSICTAIPVENCKEYDVANNKCSTCDDDYVLVNQNCKKLDSSMCGLKSETDIYYSSNNHCCKQGNYWDSKSSSCIEIPDSNCLESNDGIHCNTCAATFSPQSLHKKYFTLNYTRSILNCPNIYKRAAFYPCILTTNLAGLTGDADIATAKRMFKNCAVPDFTNKTCSTCKTGYYKPDGGKICCADGSVEVEVDGISVCRVLSTIRTNCKNFDIKTNKCLACNDTYNLSAGTCCSQFQHFDIYSESCRNMGLGECLNVDLVTQICLSCESGYYFYGTACVQEGYRFNDETYAARTAVANCKQYSPEGYCAVCDTNPNNGADFYYNYQGTCVKEKTNDAADTPLTGAGFASGATVVCKKLDIQGNCTECIASYNLIKGRCCATGEYWSGTACVAPTNNCSVADITQSTEVCTQCTSPNVLNYITDNTTITATKCYANKNDFYDQGKIFTGGAAAATVVDKVTLSLIQSTIQCQTWTKGECSQCKTGYVLSQKSIDVSVAQDASDVRIFTRCIQGTALNNCLYHDADNISHCLFCDGTKKLAANNECTGDAITNCSKSDANGCVTCSGNYLRRKKVTYPNNVETIDYQCWFNKMNPCTSLQDALVLCNSCPENYVLNFAEKKCEPLIAALQAIVANCASGKFTAVDNSTAVCDSCVTEFFRADASTCTAVTTTVTDCLYYSADGVCSQCKKGKYVTNEGSDCCPLNTIYYRGSCITWDTFIKDNCSAQKVLVSATFVFQKAQCTICDTANNYYLINETCCPHSTFAIGESCYTSNDKRATNCKKMNNLGSCSECKTNFYLTNGGCCAEGNYFDLKLQLCVAIVHTAHVVKDSGLTCLRLNDNGECSKCSGTGRLYEGLCYLSTDMINVTQLTSSVIVAGSDRFPKCSIVTNEVCTSCDATYGIGSSSTSGKCCGKTGENYFYDLAEKRCFSISAQCEKFDHIKNTCQQCANTYYSTGQFCCLENQYFNKTTRSCTNISTLSGAFKDNCIEITDTDLLMSKCSRCANSYSLIDGICYSSISSTNNCKHKFAKDCLACSGTNVISGPEVSVCCNDGDIFSTSSNSCSTQAGVSNCKNNLTTTFCQECDEDYYLAANDRCCGNGHKDTGSACEGSISIANCQTWGKKNTNDICLKCATGFNPYNYVKGGIDKTVCCADGEFLDHISETCVANTLFTSNCSQLYTFADFSYYTAPQCQSPTGYISDGFVCAANNAFNSSTETCDSINNTTYPNCNQVSGGKCLSCSTGYLIEGHCCADTEYFDGTSCVNSTSNGLTQCKKFYEECPKGQFSVDCTTFARGTVCKECNAGNYLTYNYKCCATGSFWDKVAGDCKVYNTTNAGDKHRSNIESNCDKFGENMTCIECNTNAPSGDKNNCCATTDEFVNISGACVATHNVPSLCKVYNNTTFKCTECLTGNYLTLDTCCPNGKYYQRSSKLCKTIVAATLGIDANCNQYDEFKGCIGCVSTHALDLDRVCKLIPTGCSNYLEETNLCSACSPTHYLSEFGNCCALDSFDSYGQCNSIDTNLQITNCEKFENGKCVQCDTGHYIIQGECCPYNNYYDRDNSTNPHCTPYDASDSKNVANCKRYGYAKEFCDECDDQYMLVRHLWGDKCVSMVIDSVEVISNCLKYESLYENNIQTVNCKQCSFSSTNMYWLVNNAAALPQKNILVPLTTPTVTQCEVYHILNKFEESKFVCIKCSADYYLNEIYECTQRATLNINQCNVDMPIDKDECTQCKEGYYSNYLKQCEAIPLTNCLVYDRERELCLKCSSALDVAAAGGYDQSTNDADTTYRQMRLYYYLSQDYLRSKCSLQKHTPETFPKQYRAYVHSCNADATQSDTLAINLDHFYDQYYPFHFCTDSNKIPIAFVKAGRSQTGMPYGIGNYNTKDVDTPSGMALDDIDLHIENSITFDKNADFGSSAQCIGNYNEVFGQANNDPKVTPIANCAMVMTNVEQPFELVQGTQANPDFSQLSTFCVACKTGYAPTRNGLLPIVVNACTEVANCNIAANSAPKVLNGCGECLKDTANTSNNYSFQVNSEGVVDYTRCVQTNDIHCKLLNLDGTCKYCEAGYLQNYDGICSQYKAPNCDDTAFSFQKGFTVDNFEFVLAYLGTHKGCNSCATGYKGLLVETRKLVCSESTTLKNQAFQPNSTVYDYQCDLYGVVDDKAVCVKCSTGNLLNTARKCVASSLENCVLVASATECSVCADGYLLNQGLCVLQVIQNCKDHVKNELSNELECVTCSDTYLLQNKVCVEGPVENCRTYDQTPLCTQCLDNHVLVQLSSGQQQCSPVNQEIHPNCIQYRSQAFTDNQVECLTCASLQFLPVYHDIDKDICLQLQVIDHCVLYDRQPLFINSTLKCLECQDKFVLENNKCVERKINVEHCTAYSKTVHQCVTCENNFYLGDNGTKCIAEPSGIPNCDVYSDFDICKHCTNHTYLYNNICVAVPSPILNCRYYKNSEVCVLCETGFALENNQCKQPLVSCLSYLSSTECATCPEDQGIKLENGKRICASFNVVEFCEVHDQVEPYDCLQCLSGYFLDDGALRKRCVKATVSISNCQQYSGPAECSQCATDYLLSFDKKNCLEKIFNDNCSIRSEIQPFCVQCKYGFVLSNTGECIEEQSTLPIGCLGLDNTGNCQICAPGFYMTAAKQCIGF